MDIHGHLLKPSQVNEQKCNPLHLLSPKQQHHLDAADYQQSQHLIWVTKAVEMLHVNPPTQGPQLGF